MALELTDANFEENVINSDKPALVDFWAVWCGPCRMVGPLVEEIAIDARDRDRLFNNWWSYLHDYLPKASFIRRCDGTFKRN